MRKTGKWLTVLLLAVCLCAFMAGCGENGTPAEADETSVQSGYADFTGTLLGGGEFTLSDHEGTVILLNFWATWCGPCVGEMPAFDRLMETYGDDLTLVAVDLQEDEQTVAAFMEENGYGFPVVLDQDGSIGSLYPTQGIPYTVIIAPDGTISDTSLGADTAGAMFQKYSAMIDAALG